MILLLLLTASPVLAQETEDDVEVDDNIQIKVDSILALVKPDSPDSSKMFWYYQIGVIADNSDTAIKYAQLSLELCKDGDTKFIGDNYYNIGVSYFMQDRSSEALKYFFKRSHIMRSCPKRTKSPTTTSPSANVTTTSTSTTAALHIWAGRWSFIRSLTTPPASPTHTSRLAM